MKFFVDTAELDDIKQLKETGLLDGVTTNPSLVAKSGRNFLEVIKEICDIIDDKNSPVSAECIATDYETMLKEGLKLAAIADNIAVKVPLTEDGLRTCKALADRGIQTNVTLCFSAAQALLAAKAGATYISPFVGRLDDIAHDGMQLIADIAQIYEHYNFSTQILVASVRHPQHIVQGALLGAHAATIPPAIFRQLYKHSLTDKGLQAFLADWKKTGQSIL